MPIKYGFSTKKDGSMRLAGITGIGDDPVDPQNVLNRQRFFEPEGFGTKKIIAAHLVHRNHVALVDHTSPNSIPETDGLVTTDPSVVLTTTHADCYPVYFSDESKQLIGLTHMGWRGVVKNIALASIQSLKQQGSRSEDLEIIIGPGICAKHFTVKREDAHHFDTYPEAMTAGNGEVHVDIQKIIVRQLLDAGALRENIRQNHECTHCLRDKYFSYRRDKPKVIEAQVAYITL